MGDIVGRPWSCCPGGLQPTRRAVLMTLGAAMAVAGAGITSALEDHGVAVAEDAIPVFPSTASRLDPCVGCGSTEFLQFTPWAFFEALRDVVE